MPPLLPRGTRPREGRRPAQGHTGVWTGAADIPQAPFGPVAPNLQSGRIQRPRVPRPRRESDLPPPRHHPVRGRRDPGSEKRPLHRCPARTQPLAPWPPPQEFNSLATEGRAKAPHSRPAGTQTGSGRLAERGDLSSPSPGARGPRAREGRAGRWADKRGDRQGLAYHGAAALGAHRAPRDRAAPGGRARAAP